MIKEIMLIFLIIIWLNDKINVNASALETERNNSDVKLGFLTKLRTIKLASLTKLQKVRLVAKIGVTLAEATEELVSANTEIANLKKMAILAETYNESQYITRHVNFITREHGKIAAELAMLMSYSNPNEITGKTYACEQTIPGLTRDLIKAFSTDIVTTVKFIDLTRTKNELINDAGDSNYQILVVNLFRIRTILAEFRRTLLDYVHLLDGLTANRLTADVLWYIQQLKCVDDTEEERYKIDTCSKTTLGVECIIALEVFKSVKKVDLYIPVNYHNYQLQKPSDMYHFAKDENEQWGWLECKKELTGEEIIGTDTCSFKADPGKCLNNFDMKSYEEIKDSCHFEYAKPKPVIQTNDGFLIQSKEITVREKEDDRRMVILDKNVPYLLKTGKPVSVIYNEAEEVYEPREKEVVRKLKHTYLTQKQVNHLNTLQLLQSMDMSYVYEEYILIGSVCITVFISLSVVITCICKRTQIRQYIIRRSVEEESASRRSNNYRLNRALLKNPSTPPVFV
jgi:hypothetical protein